MLGLVAATDYEPAELSPSEFQNFPEAVTAMRTFLLVSKPLPLLTS